MNLPAFPRTPHLSISTLVDDNDFFAAPAEEAIFLDHEIVIQEKLDGSNVGFTLVNGIIVPRSRRDAIHPEEDTIFKKLAEWAKINDESLGLICDGQHTLFGEWLYWRHSIPYDQLPSFFVAHDIYDEHAKKFFSSSDVEDILSITSIKYNRPLFRGILEDLNDVRRFVKKSQFGPQQMEGVYIRADDKEYNVARAKYVTSEFKEGIKEHWRTKPLVPNHSVAELEKYWTL